MVPCEFVEPEIPKSHFGKFDIQFSPYSKLRYTECLILGIVNINKSQINKTSIC